MQLTRRDFCQGTAILALAGLAGLSFPDMIAPAMAQEPSQADLAQAGPDGDIVLGAENAPVTIIEYASMTCSHCAHFSVTTFPELKKRYIDTGKVRFIMREFPLDPLAAAGFMLARCAGKDKFMPIVETLFASQADWVVQKPIEPLKAIAKQAGFTEESFEACLANQKVLDSIQTVRDRASQKLGVNSTPTFFINGKRHNGDVPMDELVKAIDPYLKAG